MFSNSSKAYTISFPTYWVVSGMRYKLTKTNNGTVNLYAQWKPREYTITYELNGGENNTGNSSTYTILTSRKLKNPTKEGYKFGGWYSDKDFTKRVTEIVEGTTGNKKFYAKWKLPKAVITSVQKMSYDENRIKIASADVVDGADEYILYRSTSRTSGYKVIGTYTAYRYSGTDIDDEDVQPNTVYYYKVVAKGTMENGMTVYSDESDVVQIRSAQKPNFTGTVLYLENQYSSYVTLSLTNRGNLDLYVGGSSVTNFANVYPYEDASYTKGYYLGSSGSQVNTVYWAPGQSGYVNLRLEMSRYFTDGAHIVYFFQYDDCSYIASTYDDGSTYYA